MRIRFLLPVALVVLVAGAFRAEDTSFKPDEEGFIRNWLVLAPLRSEMSPLALVRTA